MLELAELSWRGGGEVVACKGDAMGEGKGDEPSQ